MISGILSIGPVVKSLGNRSRSPWQDQQRGDQAKLFRRLFLIITATGCLFRLKSGRTSAPRLPQAWQTNLSSMSDSLIPNPIPIRALDLGGAGVANAITPPCGHEQK